MKLIHTNERWVHPEMELKRVFGILDELGYFNMDKMNLEDVMDCIRDLNMGQLMNIKAEDANFLYSYIK